MSDTHQTVRPATERQIQYAESLGIDPGGKSFRVLSAEIEDVLEARAVATVEDPDRRSPLAGVTSWAARP